MSTLKHTHEQFTEEWADPPVQAKATTRYKVVCKEGDKLLSVNTCGSGKNTVIYEPMKWAIAPIGGLLVFVDEEIAHSFLSHLNTIQLNRSECEYRVYQLWACDCWEEQELPVRRFGGLRCEGIKTSGDDLRSVAIIDDTMRKIWKPNNSYCLTSCQGFDQRISLDLWPRGTEAWKYVRLVSPVEEKYHIITAA